MTERAAIRADGREKEDGVMGVQPQHRLKFAVKLDKSGMALMKLLPRILPHLPEDVRECILELVSSGLERGDVFNAFFQVDAESYTADGTVWLRISLEPRDALLRCLAALEARDSEEEVVDTNGHGFPSIGCDSDRHQADGGRASAGRQPADVYETGGRGDEVTSCAPRSSRNACH